MDEAMLIERLRKDATCQTSHPAHNAAALIGAAAAVLQPRFNKYQIANLIASGVFEGLSLSTAIDMGTVAGLEGLTEPEMTRLFVKRGR